MPRSILLGRPMPRPGEPLWLDDDLDAVLEYLREEKLLCSGCGLPRDETMDPGAEGHFRARVLRCFACQAREREAQKFNEKPHQAGGIVYAVERH